MFLMDGLWLLIIYSSFGQPRESTISWSITSEMSHPINKKILTKLYNLIRSYKVEHIYIKLNEKCVYNSWGLIHISESWKTIALLETFYLNFILYLYRFYILLISLFQVLGLSATWVRCTCLLLQFIICIEKTLVLCRDPKNDAKMPHQ